RVASLANGFISTLSTTPSGPNLYFRSDFILMTRRHSLVRRCAVLSMSSMSDEHAGRTRTCQDLILQVIVRDNNVDQALRALKKKLQREGVFREMKARRSYEKPSEKRVREKAEAVRRAQIGRAHV